MAQSVEQTTCMDYDEPRTIDEPRLELRPTDVVMDLRRLGCLYQYPLSFMRMLVRRIVSDAWKIIRRRFDLDADGYGVAIYEIRTPQDLYSFVVFSSYLDPQRRSDRVIADQWDITVTLCVGTVDNERLEHLRSNVPKQERGRLKSDSIVLSRANKSVRNFEYVVNELASGRQPSLSVMAKVGYLYRTTAVYGSGKFGMADWQKVRVNHPDFASPFAAELFTCYMIRQFSLEQADFLATTRSPDSAVAMDDAIKRYMGIGNATGLGMAPYLISHPLLICRWIETRETALARVLQYESPTHSSVERLESLTRRAIRHLGEISTDNDDQNAINAHAMEEMARLLKWFEQHRGSIENWRQLVDRAATKTSIETQELLNTLLMEVYPARVHDLEDSLCVDEEYELLPEMPLSELNQLIETHYDWALAIDFSKPDAQTMFWYRSEEKMEPRLGNRSSDTGVEHELTIDVARAVQRCHQAISNDASNRDRAVAWFLFSHPEHRLIVRRIQAMSNSRFGDIRANLLAADVLPIHLLRCKLSFFGVGKFDPRSRLWVRNTMFQGAPVCSDIGTAQGDDWCFPVIPDVGEMEPRH